MVSKNVLNGVGIFGLLCVLTAFILVLAAPGPVAAADAAEQEKTTLGKFESKKDIAAGVFFAVAMACGLGVYAQTGGTFCKVPGEDKPSPHNISIMAGTIVAIMAFITTIWPNKTRTSKNSPTLKDALAAVLMGSTALIIAIPLGLRIKSQVDEPLSGGMRGGCKGKWNY